MTKTRRILGSVAAATMLTSALAVTSAPAAQAADNCTFDSPRTIMVVTLRSRSYELRANPQNCVWGRVTGGSPGDYVWVDRRYPNSEDWEQLSITRIDTGGSAHTAAYDDKKKLMRACGHAAGYPSEVACTNWW